MADDAGVIAGQDGADLSAVVKAYVVSDAGAVVSSANARGVEDELAQLYQTTGALAPRYEPWHCALLYEKSSALRPCVESYATNIDAFGFHLEPVIDLEKSDADDRIRAAIRQQRMHDADPTPVSDEDVGAMRAIIQREAEIEEFRLLTFFAYCCPDSSFVDLRQETRVELESTGNGYWEVVRDGAGCIQSFHRIDAVTMRLRPLQREHVVVDTPQKVSPIAYADVPVPRRFRSYVQLLNGVDVCYFKQFGDPRVMSARTGRYYETVEELRREETNAVVATEVIHHRIFSPIGPYGVPRWVGATMNIAGLRASEEVNYTYFDNKGVPPLALLVSGGALRQGATEKIERYIRENIKGRQNFHSVLIIEAASSGGAAGDARCRIELQNLMEAQLQDALFQGYEANSDRKVGRQFRLPDLLRGASQEVNRAQAEAVLQMAEQQVFQPIRESFDHLMTRYVFADMGIRFWTFVSNSATAADAAELTELGTKWVQAGVLTPNEGRSLAGDALNKDYKTLDDGWAQQPLPVTLAGILPGDMGAPVAPAAPMPAAPGADPGAAPTAPAAPEQKLAPLAAQIIALQEALRAGSEAGHAIEVKRARAAAGAHVIRVPDDFFRELVDEDAR